MTSLSLSDRRTPPTNGNGNGLLTTVKNTLLIAAFGTACVTVGYNLRELGALSKRVDDHIAASAYEHQAFAQRESVAIQHAGVQRQLEDLKELVSEVLRRQRLR